MKATTGRIWEAASTDQRRPVLMGVYFDAKKGTLAASDSYVLVRVPCEVEDGDESGLIPAEAIKAAQGESLAVRDGKATLQFADGERTWNLLEGTPPNFDEILAGAEPGAMPFGLNPAMLSKVGKAISNGDSGLTLNPFHPLKAIRVSNGYDKVEALVMPVRVSGDQAPPPKTPDLSDDDRVLEAAKAAVAALERRRGKKRAADAFRKALAA